MFTVVSRPVLPVEGSVEEGVHQRAGEGQERHLVGIYIVSELTMNTTMKALYNECPPAICVYLCWLILSQSFRLKFI